MLNEIACPNCRRRLRLREEALGREVKCPSCLTQFMAPLPEETPQLLDPLDPSTEPDAIAPNPRPTPRVPEPVPPPRIDPPWRTVERFEHLPLSPVKKRPKKKEPWWMVWLVGSLICIVLVSLAAFNKNENGNAPPLIDDREERHQDIIAAMRDEVKLPDDQIAQELRVLFDNLTVAFRNHNGNEIMNQFDVTRMYDELLAMDVMPREMKRDRKGATRGLRMGMAQSFSQQAGIMEWERFEVRHLKMLRDGEAVVIVRHFTKDGVNLKMRWWVIRAGGRWRVFDMEDLDCGLRISAVMASVMGMAGQNPMQLTTAFSALRDAMNSLVGQPDLDLVDRKLREAATFRMPDKLEALRYFAQGLAYIHRDKSDEALKAFDQASILNPDMPILDLMRGSLFNKLQQWDKALKHLQIYRELLGDDTQVCAELGLTYRQLYRFADSALVYRKALEINPKDAAAYEGLALSLTADDDLSDLQPRFAKLDDKQETFESVASQLLRNYNSEVLEQVVIAMRKADPLYPSADYYLALVKARTGKTVEAVAAFKLALSREKNVELRKDYVKQFLQAMAVSNKAVDAYLAAPDAKEAFRLLAQQMKVSYVLDGIKQLLDAHRKKHPEDPLLPFYQGELHVREKQYKLAEEAFALGMKNPPDREALEGFTYNRVLARYHAGTGLTAYNAIGERQQTFDQLAWLYLNDKNYAQLQSLIDAHAKHDPESHNLLDMRLRLQIRQGMTAEAIALFQKSLPKKIDDEDKSEFVATFLSEMRSNGKVIEGYDAIPDGRQAFRILMDERDDEGLRFDVKKLLDHHRTKHPDDLNLLYWMGAREADEQKWDPAVKLLEQVMKNGDKMLRDRARWRYVNALYRSVGPLRAYERSTDKKEAYQQLANLLVSERKGDDLEALVQMHRPNAGDDPELLFHAAQASIFQKKLDEAMTRFKDAYRNQPNGHKRNFLSTSFVQNMTAEGRGVEAYRVVPEKAAAFQTLARDYVTRQKPEELSKLLEEHGALNGRAPLLAHYRGELYLLRGEAVEAEHHFKAALASGLKRDEWMFRNGLYRAGVKAGKTAVLYQEQGANREIFEALAQICLTQKDPRQLQALLAEHRKVDPKDENLLAWDCDVFWLNKDYEGTLKLLTEHSKGVFSQPRHSWKANDRRVRCLVKLKRYAEAQAEVQKLSGEEEDFALLRMLIPAEQGNVKETMAVLDKLPATSYLRTWCYSDEDLGPLLRSESFKSFREKYPEPKQ